MNIMKTKNKNRAARGHTYTHQLWHKLTSNRILINYYFEGTEVVIIISKPTMDI